MSKRKLASIEIWNNSIYIIPVLTFLDSVAINHKGMDLTRYHSFRFVVGEILKTRIEKSYPGSTGKLYFDLFLSDTEIEISIRDKGVPGWQDFSYDLNCIADSEKDRRNYIIDRSVDGIGMEKLGKDGQRTFVSMRILNAIEFKKPELYEPMDVLDENISIRQVETEEDIIQAIRCIYSEYGYSYSYEGLYYVDSFMRKIKSGELMSFLAVNDHGQIAGHFALVFSDLFKSMPEVSTVVIRKEFRSLGLFAKFMDHCINIGIKNNLRAIMGQPVAYHPMSQKATIRAGFTATSFLMAYIGSDIESEYNKTKQRLDLAVAVRILDSKAKSKVYPPAELRAFIDRIYGKMGWEYELADGAEVGEYTEILIENKDTLRATGIIVREAAEDLEEALQESIRAAIRKKNEMIELLILLNTPSCEHAYQTAKKCGFALSGVVPGGENGDYLVMQMLTGDKINYDNLVTVGEFEDLKDEILELNK